MLLYVLNNDAFNNILMKVFRGEAPLRKCLYFTHPLKYFFCLHYIFTNEVHIHYLTIKMTTIFLTCVTLLD